MSTENGVTSYNFHTSDVGFRPGRRNAPTGPDRDDGPQRFNRANGEPPRVRKPTAPGQVRIGHPHLDHQSAGRNSPPSIEVTTFVDGIFVKISTTDGSPSRIVCKTNRQPLGITIALTLMGTVAPEVPAGPEVILVSEVLVASEVVFSAPAFIDPSSGLRPRPIHADTPNSLDIHDFQDASTAPSASRQPINVPLLVTIGLPTVGPLATNSNSAPAGAPNQTIESSAAVGS